MGDESQVGNSPGSLAAKWELREEFIKRPPQKPLKINGTARWRSSQHCLFRANWSKSRMAGRLKGGPPPLREVFLRALTCSSLQQVQACCGHTVWLHTLRLLSNNHTCAHSDGRLLGPSSSVYIECG